MEDLKVVKFRHLFLVSSLTSNNNLSLPFQMTSSADDSVGQKFLVLFIKFTRCYPRNVQKRSEVS